MPRLEWQDIFPKEWTGYVTASALIALNILSGLSVVRLSFVHHD